MLQVLILVCLAVYLLAMFGVGIYGKKYATNFSDYLTAGKQSTVLMVIGTAVGAHIGSGFIIGGAESAVLDGYGGVWYGLGCAFSYLLVSFTIAKLVQRRGYVTLSDYFLTRYKQKNVRLIYSVSTALAYLGILAGQIMAGKAIFEGFGYNGAIGAIITTVVVLFYSTMSGLWGAYVTSIIQSGIIVVGLVGTAVHVLVNGGWEIVTNTLPASQFNLFCYDPETWVMLVIPVLASAIVDQGNFQRCASSKSEKVAVWGHLGAFVVLLGMACLPVVIGMYGAALYPDAVPSSIFFTVVLGEFPALLGAILVSAVLAAVMSTADMSFMCISATVVHDIYKGMIDPEASDKKLQTMATWANVVVCVLGLALALSASSILSLLSSVYSLIVAGCLVPFVGGLFWSKGNAKGAISSAVVGIGLFLLDMFGIVSIPFASISTVIPAAVAYVAVSLMTRSDRTAERLEA